MVAWVEFCENCKSEINTISSTSVVCRKCGHLHVGSTQREEQRMRQQVKAIEAEEKK